MRTCIERCVAYVSSIASRLCVALEVGSASSKGKDDTIPRYFFNRIDGIRDPDVEGVELAGLADARYEAIAFAADTLKDDSFALWDGGEVRIEVVDSARALIFSIVISVVDDTTRVLTG